MDVVLIIAIAIVTFFFTEVFAYIWHRYASHEYNTLLVRASHKIHHQTVNQHINEDFYLLLPGVIAVYAIGYYLTVIKILPLDYYLTIVIVSFITFLLNWYSHKAYHDEKNWLNQYKWFKNKKKSHFKHHTNAKRNFGIATNFTDELMGTFY